MTKYNLKDFIYDEENPLGGQQPPGHQGLSDREGGGVALRNNLEANF